MRETYGSISNLEMTGFIDQFATDRLARILERSWVLINTSAREGLPNTFLEAAAHRCAILSQVDHEGFASRFGYHAADGDLAGGWPGCWRRRRWRAGGERAYEHARQVYATERAIQAHLSAYHQARGRGPAAKSCAETHDDCEGQSSLHRSGFGGPEAAAAVGPGGLVARMARLGSTESSWCDEHATRPGIGRHVGLPVQWRLPGRTRPLFRTPVRR